VAYQTHIANRLFEAAAVVIHRGAESELPWPAVA
jgi:hypothetical protein